jgi:hypothetical protein
MLAVLLSIVLWAADPVDPIELQLVSSQHIDYPTHHVQGLEVDADHYWITSVDRRARRGWVYRVDRRSLKVEASRDLTEGPRCHPGGMQRGEGGLWIPLAEYRPKSSTSILKIDPRTLQTIHSGQVQDHLGAIVLLNKDELLGCNWDSLQYLWMDSTGKVRERFDNPTGVAYQDAKFHEGKLWAAGRTKIAGRTRSVVDVVSWPQRTLERRFLLSGKCRTGGDNFSNEGFCLLEGSLYLLPEDGPHSTVYRFDLPKQ